MAMRKYLDLYAEAEAVLPGLQGTQYRHVLCIPAFAEPASFLSKCLQHVETDRLLIILVINANESASPENKALTIKLYEQLADSNPLKLQLAEHVSLHQYTQNIDLLLLQRCKPGYTLTKGVGQARKIACDIAVKLIDEGVIESLWIHSTDADATVPEDYFDAVMTLNVKEVAAGIYPFQHLPSPNQHLQLAQQLYDCSLNYYVDGQAWAGSPWAFHTIGSTLVINAEHYAIARGFPQREAGEDFYLLNKLGKTGEISRLDSKPVALTTRPSDRVPFGTGPAIKKILRMQDPLRDFLFYHPACFQYLKGWHGIARYLWEETQTSLTTNFIAGHTSDVDPEILMSGMEALGVNRFLEHAFSHSKSASVFSGHMHHWFDAFLTLKAIHWWRDHHFPSLNLEAALQLLPEGFTYLPVLPASASADCGQEQPA